MLCGCCILRGGGKKQKQRQDPCARFGLITPQGSKNGRRKQALHAHQLKSMRFGARARGLCPGAASRQHRSAQSGTSQTLFYFFSAHPRTLHGTPKWELGRKRRELKPFRPRPLRAGPCLPPARGPAPRITRPPPAAALPPPRSLRLGTPRGSGGPGLSSRSSPAAETSREAGEASEAGRERERSRAAGGERGGEAGLGCAAEGSEGRSALMGGGGRAKMAAPCGPEEPGVVNS